MQRVVRVEPASGARCLTNLVRVRSNHAGTVTDWLVLTVTKLVGRLRVVTDNDGARTIGQSIREIREALGVSQAELANSMRDRGFSNYFPQTIAKLEGGRRSLQFDEGVAMADILGVAAEDLAGINLNTWADDAAARRDLRLLLGAAVNAREAFTALKVGDAKVRWHLKNGDLSKAVRVELEAHLGQQGATTVADQFTAHAATAPEQWWNPS